MADWKNVHLAEQDEKIADLTRRLAEAEADGTQETARAEHATMRANVAEARVREIGRELSDERRDHQQTIRVMAEEIQRLKAENALIAESYKAAHDEVIRLRREAAK